MTVNSEFQYVHAAAVSSQLDESAMRWAVCSIRCGVIRCSKSMTRKPFDERLRGIAVGEAPDRLVAEVEAEPDQHLEAEIGPASREDPASGCGDGGHEVDSRRRGGFHELPADVRHLDLRQGRSLGRAEVGIPVCASVPYAPYRQRELFI